MPYKWGTRFKKKEEPTSRLVVACDAYTKIVKSCNAHASVVFSLNLQRTLLIIYAIQVGYPIQEKRKTSRLVVACDAYTKIVKSPCSAFWRLYQIRQLPRPVTPKASRATTNTSKRWCYIFSSALPEYSYLPCPQLSYSM